MVWRSPAPVAQGIEHRPPEAVAQVRILPGAPKSSCPNHPDVLATVPGESFAATFVVRARSREGRPDSTLLVLRHRYVGHGMREDLVLRNFGGPPVSCRLELKVPAD